MMTQTCGKTVRVHLCWRSVNFLAAQPQHVRQDFAHRACVLRQECKGLPVNEGEQGLVARRPHPVPRSVEGVGHRRTQHVVQVDLSRLQMEHMWID